jgi:hypothetical protein
MKMEISLAQLFLKWDSLENNLRNTPIKINFLKLANIYILKKKSITPDQFNKNVK